MDWKKFESEIFETFTRSYPDASIAYNQKVTGRYSKTERQIDVLIEGYIAGKRIRLVLDAKFYNKRIDVKEVESFISMVEDVDAAQGILITSKGYSKAAINRAYYGPTDIELDILSFEELKKFQGSMGITYSRKHGAIIPAPFGWIIDGTKRNFAVATLYQRGSSFERATKAGEWVYFNIFSYGDKIQNLDDVIAIHQKETLIKHPGSTFEYHSSIKRPDNRETRLRTIKRKETHLIEYTGFVGFDDFCVFAVLFTPLELSNKNIRKLEYVIERLLPLNVNEESIMNTEVSSRRSLIAESTSNEEKAGFLITIAEIYRDFQRHDKSIDAYKESITYFPKNYGAQLGLLELGIEERNRDELMNDFFNLDPGNRKICDDLVRICLTNGHVDLLETFFKSKLVEHSGKDEILGCIYFSLGDLFYSTDSAKKAHDYFELAERSLSKAFGSKHEGVKAARKGKLEMKKLLKSGN